MQFQTLSIIMPLVGVCVGLGGALAIEWVRGSQATRREAADRRERFQVETLTRLQDVGKSLYSHMLEIHWYVRHDPDKARTLPSMTAYVEALKQTVALTGELTMLMSRVRDRDIATHTAVFLELAKKSGDDELSEAELDKAFWMAGEAYKGLQALAGAGILEILGGMVKPSAPSTHSPGSSSEEPKARAVQHPPTDSARTESPAKRHA